MSAPTPNRTEPPANGSEPETLLGFLQHHRDTLAMKCDGLNDEQLRQRLHPTPMTLAGLLAHMGTVEDFWCSSVLMDAPFPFEHWPAEVKDDPEWEWTTGAALPGDELRQRWAGACLRSDDVLARINDLDEIHAAWGGKKHVSVRWVLVHLIEEYARHNGHADLLRENIDGETGC